MGEWATANRVKKVNTRLNKAARAKAGVDRDMLEPDETDGPVVLEELGTWPDGTSLEEHLAEDEDTRIFSPDEHRAPVEGEDVAGTVHGAGLPPQPRRVRQVLGRQAQGLAAAR